MEIFRSGQLALFVLTALLLLAGCTTAPPITQRPYPADASPLASRLLPRQANDVTIYAMGLVGTPYRFGGNTPDSGFDCSGLIGHVYKTTVNVVPPRTVSKLNLWGQAVPIDGAQSGDLVVFSQRDTATHAGIYVGNGRFVHAPSTGGEVRIDDLSSKYWSAQQIAFRRP